MENERLQGVVKFFRGSFGWLTCADAKYAKQIGDRDIFLHKNQLNSVPTIGAVVEFKLVVDAKGQPKAEDAIVLNGVAEARAGAKDSKVQSKEMQVKRAALMLFRGDDILVIREKKDDQDVLLWSDLGGKVESGESFLECAIRELDEEPMRTDEIYCETQGFLAPKSIEMLKLGLRNQYGDERPEICPCARQSPEVIALKAAGNKPQAVAVFPLDCSGVELDGAPGMSFLQCWLSRKHPDLRDRSRTRWPLLRAVCALRGASILSWNRLKASMKTLEQSGCWSLVSSTWALCISGASPGGASVGSFNFTKEQCARIIELQQKYQVAGGDHDSAAVVAQYAAVGFDLSSYVEARLIELSCCPPRVSYDFWVGLLEFRDGEKVTFQVEYDDKLKPRVGVPLQEHPCPSFLSLSTVCY
eukprot:Skav212218  [mRNA]  locus=scaffold862:48032:56864:+ [translate_table: standard]